MMPGVMAMIDSGVGGLSVLLAIKQRRPDLIINYLADAKNTPFGEKSHDFIISRGHQLVDWFYDKKNVVVAPHVMVVACNTITVHGIANLRATKPAINFVGVEPGLKPAVTMTRNKRVALLATRATLDSPLIKEKIKNYEKEAAIFSIAGVGLVDEIEKHGAQSKNLETLLKKYLAMVATAKADVLVLGCTHYSFLQTMIKKILPAVTIIDTAAAVAERAISFFPERDDKNNLTGKGLIKNSSPIDIFTTGDVVSMKNFIASVTHFPTARVNKIEL